MNDFLQPIRSPSKPRATVGYSFGSQQPSLRYSETETSSPTTARSRELLAVFARISAGTHSSAA